MSPISALVYKDLSKYKLLICIWIGLLVLMVISPLSVFKLAQSDSAAPVLILWILRHFMAMLLWPALIMQSDSLQKPDGFWLSRPIERTQLLMAKLLILSFICIVLPVAAESCYVSIIGLPSSKLALFILGSICSNAALVAPYILIAALTASLPMHFICSLPVILLAGLKWFFRNGFSIFWSGPETAANLALRQSLFASRSLVSDLLLIFTVIYCLVVLYKRRNNGAVAAVLTVTLSVCTIIRLTWPYVIVPTKENSKSLITGAIEVNAKGALLKEAAGQEFSPGFGDSSQAKKLSLLELKSALSTNQPSVVAHVERLKDIKVTLLDGSQLDLTDMLQPSYLQQEKCVSDAQLNKFLSANNFQLEANQDKTCEISDFLMGSEQIARLRQGVSRIDANAEIQLHEIEISADSMHKLESSVQYPELNYFSLDRNTRSQNITKVSFNLIFDDIRALPNREFSFYAGTDYLYLAINTEQQRIEQVSHYRTGINDPFGVGQITQSSISLYDYSGIFWFGSSDSCIGSTKQSPVRIIELKLNYLRTVSVPLELNNVKYEIFEKK